MVCNEKDNYRKGSWPVGEVSEHIKLSAEEKKSSAI